jgi:hypothetical protein
MKKILSFAAIALAVQSCYSMKFLSPEGLEAAERLKHAEFIMAPDGKLSEIKLKETEETIQYRAAVKTGINGKLEEFFAKKFPKLKREVYQKNIDEFFQIFDRNHSGILHSYFGLNILNEYCASVYSLFYSSNVEELNNELKDILLPILDKYYKDITLHIEIYMHNKPPCCDFFLKYSEENLTSFSEEISPELFAQLPPEYAFSRENIRIITADSILAGFEALGLLSPEVMNFYKSLMIKSPETDVLLLQQYAALLEESNFIKFAELASKDFNIKYYKFRQEVDVERYRKNVMQMIQMSIDSILRRQTFVLFLATHKYICDKCKSIPGSENKLSFEDRDLSDGSASAQYPEFSVNMDPQRSFEAITFTTAKEKSSILGYEKTTFIAPGVLAHEFRHGYHLPLGLGSHDDSKYLIDCLGNFFMKDLLFPDFEQIRDGIKQHIEGILAGLSEADAAQFSEQIRSYFNLSWMPRFLENVPDPSDRVSFAEILSHKLALAATTQIWDDPEEINNIIGIQIVGKTLFVNRLSDLNVSIADGRRVSWTHLGGDKERLKRGLLLEEEGKAPVTAPIVKQFIMNFHTNYGVLSDIPLNHPTPEALRVLEILHNVKGALIN